MVDRYGFQLGYEPASTQSEREQLAHVRLENSRALKWQAMIADWDTYFTGPKRAKLASRVRKGIPDGARGHVWLVASGAMAAQRKHPNRYQQLLLNKNSPMDGQIEKDLNRTMPQHVYFQHGDEGKRQLFNVCRALAIHVPDVGYSQAEAYVAAALLTYMPEESAFWALRHICCECKQGDMWAPSLHGWVAYRAILDKLVHTRMPRLHAHLEANGVTPDLYALQWFMTLYSKDFPFESMLRIWDLFLCKPHPHGSKILFSVALAILKEGESDLLRMHDVQQLTEHIRRLPYTTESLRGDQLITKARAVGLKTNALFPPDTLRHGQHVL